MMMILVRILKIILKMNIIVIWLNIFKLFWFLLLWKNWFMVNVVMCVKNMMKVFIIFWISVRVIMLSLEMWLILWVNMAWILLWLKWFSKLVLIVIRVVFLFYFVVNVLDVLDWKILILGILILVLFDNFCMVFSNYCLVWFCGWLIIWVWVFYFVMGLEIKSDMSELAKLNMV